MSQATKLLKSTDTLIQSLAPLTFSAPTTHVYNPLEYARAPHTTWIKRFGNSTKKILFLGMNPGPFGMAQTGIPFGEIPAVRDWIGINEQVSKPKNEHPKRPIQGFDCTRSEVSGRRLWSLFSERFDSPEAFFADHYVVNYCPLVFMEESGRNRTPDKLPAKERDPVYAACDIALRDHVDILKPEYIIGVGAFAETRARDLFAETHPQLKIARILHPSPASPAANKDWPGTATQQLKALNLW